jgi:hypothetical protein
MNAGDGSALNQLGKRAIDSSIQGSILLLKSDWYKGQGYKA